mgnify:CR=1 FL=1
MPIPLTVKFMNTICQNGPKRKGSRNKALEKNLLTIAIVIG